MISRCSIKNTVRRKKWKQIICNRKLSLDIRIRVTKCYGWSVNKVHVWTLKFNTMRSIEAFEIEAFEDGESPLYGRIFMDTHNESSSNEQNE